MKTSKILSREKNDEVYSNSYSKQRRPMLTVRDLDITKMKLWSLRSAYNNYEIIVVTASLGVRGVKCQQNS